MVRKDILSIAFGSLFVFLNSGVSTGFNITRWELSFLLLLQFLFRNLMPMVISFPIAYFLELVIASCLPVNFWALVVISLTRSIIPAFGGMRPNRHFPFSLGICFVDTIVFASKGLWSFTHMTFFSAIFTILCIVVFFFISVALFVYCSSPYHNRAILSVLIIAVLFAFIFGGPATIRTGSVTIIPHFIRQYYHTWIESPAPIISNASLSIHEMHQQTEHHKNEPEQIIDKTAKEEMEVINVEKPRTRRPTINLSLAWLFPEWFLPWVPVWLKTLCFLYLSILMMGGIFYGINFDGPPISDKESLKDRQQFFKRKSR
eukprot:TRINITY_DN13752_c0_g1_i1.p1 TRINITY_DN13752_c0_g1~~TRINITY_DN13752_c0_g1_i1.p1  ORF type:complete len:317 (+),score=17.41 TRINITY_DN13752_c0_g1_i1:30-980(+)